MLNKYKSKIILLFVLISSAVLRFVNLGYSEFQGDEIRALYLKSSGPLLEHLFTQKKGPAQFVITFIMNELFRLYSEFWLRVPFALVGLACVVVLYYLVKELYGKKAGILAATLLSINGFFVAFSRIVQYQSLVIFFTLLTAFFLVKLNSTKSIKYMYFASISAGLGLLSHYDIAFASLYFFYLLGTYVYSQWKSGASLKNMFFNLFLAAFIFLLITSTFYVPFILHQSSQNTTSYLFMRINGADGGKKITDTFITYLIYNPLTSFYILLSVALLSFLFSFKKSLPLILWFLPPFVMMNFYVSIPGTHIYTYVIPVIVASSLAVVSLINKISITALKGLVILPVIGFILLSYIQVFSIFVDHTPEYPWNTKKVLFWPVSLPDKRYHLSLFGFPYYRELEEMNKAALSRGGIVSINSNEGSKIIRYYIDLKEPFLAKYDAYLYVYGAQSHVKSKSSKVKGLEPTKVFEGPSGVLSELYLIERPEVKGVETQQILEEQSE